MNLLTVRNSSIIGGAELYYLKLAEAFRKHNLDCKIHLVTNNQVLADKARLHGIESYVVNTYSEEVGTKRGFARLLFHLPNYLWKYLKTIRKILHHTKLNAIVLSSTTEKITLTPFIRLFGLPVFWLEHGQVFTSTKTRVVLVIYKYMSRFANKILAEAKDTMVNLVQNNINPTKIIYISSGIDKDYFAFKRNYNKKTFTVGFMATVCWEKGILEFLHTMQEVNKKNKSIKFLVIGDGPQLSYAKQYTINNNLSNTVLYTGYQENPKKYLSQMDIILSPIHHPGGLSLSIETAMSMGVVPIVSNIGGNRELVINRITGFVISNGFVKNAYKIILHLYNNRKLLVQESLAARKHIITNYSSVHWVKKWFSVINSV